MKRIMKIRALFVLVAMLGLSEVAIGQNLSVKTNLLYGATTTPNLALELGLSKKTTLELVGGYNNWELSNDGKIFAHWLVQPGVRHWFCERFAGTFVGVHAHVGEFNLNRMGPLETFKNNRYDGWFAGAGVSVGHQWLLGKRWGLEAEIGAGYAYVDYKKYDCEKCSPVKDQGVYHYFGPTKASISLVFYIK